MNQFQDRHHRRLRLNRNDTRTQTGKGRNAIADMRTDIENEIAALNELAVEAIHGRGVRTIAVVDAKRPKNAARGLQQSEHVSDRTEGRHR